MKFKFKMVSGYLAESTEKDKIDISPQLPPLGFGIEHETLAKEAEKEGQFSKNPN